LGCEHSQPIPFGGSGDEDFFPILRPLDWTNSHEALLVGCMTRGSSATFGGEIQQVVKTLLPSLVDGFLIVISNNLQKHELIESIFKNAIMS